MESETLGARLVKKLKFFGNGESDSLELIELNSKLGNISSVQCAHGDSKGPEECVKKLKVRLRK
jgi:hypothetical protein